MSNRTGRVGAKVRYKHWIAKIERKLPSLARGAVLLDRPILDMRYWNMDELKYVRTK